MDELNLSFDYLKEISIKINVATEKGNALKTVDLVTFTAEILNGKLHFLCRESIAKMKSDTKQTMKLEQLYKVGSECEMNSWLDRSVG